MRKLLEYRVFDILKDPENEKFLDKVKKENRDLYAKFLNLVGNKGLEFAKKEYQYHDPEYKKQQEQKEKEEKALIKKIGRKEYKERQNQSYLDQWASEIKEVQNILLSSELKNLANKIKMDKRLNDFLSNTKKQYHNDFLDILKKPKYLYLEFNHDMKIGTLSYTCSAYGYWDDDLSMRIMRIVQLYNQKTKKLTYSIFFDLPESGSYTSPKSDRTKEREFIIQRNEHIKVMRKSNISLEELYDILFNKVSPALDERVYDKWYEKWKMMNNANKYNI